MRTKKNHKVLCYEAACLLAQVGAVRIHHGKSITDDIERMIHKMEFRAENIAGEAGVVAAVTGSSGQVPDILLPYRVLVIAFVAEFSLEVEHMRRVLETVLNADRGRSVIRT